MVELEKVGEEHPITESIIAAESQTMTLLNILYKLGVTVHDFQDSAVLHGRINESVKELQALANLKKSCEKIAIPGALLDYIENGRNPELFNETLHQSLLDKNQKTAGRIGAIKMLHDDLRMQIAATFPELLAQDREASSPSLN